MENKIYVIYIGIANVEDEHRERYFEKVKDSLIPTSVEGEFIIIPTNSIDTRIECINPEYITDNELIRKHRLLIDELHEHLKFEIDEKE